jgi:hypothetical protein
MHATTPRPRLVKVFLFVLLVENNKGLIGRNLYRNIKKMLADPTTTASGLIERYPFLITTSYVVIIKTIILTNRFFV